VVAVLALAALARAVTGCIDAPRRGWEEPEAGDYGPADASGTGTGTSTSSGGGSGSGCPDLVARTCGEALLDGGYRCQVLPACEASLLLLQNQHEAGYCAEPLEDELGFPACDAELGCTELLLRCCGTTQGDVGCEEEPGCVRARDLQRSDQAVACRQALGDTTGFPPCTLQR
jgi:hypothetical protein